MEKTLPAQRAKKASPAGVSCPLGPTLQPPSQCFPSALSQQVVCSSLTSCFSLASQAL